MIRKRLQVRLKLGLPSLWCRALTHWATTPLHKHILNKRLSVFFFTLFCYKNVCWNFSNTLSQTCTYTKIKTPEKKFLLFVLLVFTYFQQWIKSALLRLLYIYFFLKIMVKLRHFCEYGLLNMWQKIIHFCWFSIRLH